MPPVDNDDIRWLITLTVDEGLTELEVNEGDVGVVVRREGPAVGVGPWQPAETPGETEIEPEGLVPVLAPMAGAFYRSSAPDVPAFAEEGDDVQEGETVALIEAMKLYNDVEAPCSGRVEKVFVDDGTRVAADQQLMMIRPVG
jgi:acetyl-CoA carboxylase biotin carboxyl carrier protein